LRSSPTGEGAFARAGRAHDLIAAVFAHAEDDLVRLLARVSALQSFLDTDDGANLLTAYRRAANIVSIEQRRDNRKYDSAMIRTLFRQDEERRCHRPRRLAVKPESSSFEKISKSHGRARAAAPAALTRFFDKVTVNTDDAQAARERLRSCRASGVMNQVADFSQIRDDQPMTKWSNSFGAGRGGPRRHARSLGREGRRSAEMSNLGLPVPPGFTITTDLHPFLCQRKDLSARSEGQAGARCCGRGAIGAKFAIHEIRFCMRALARRLDAGMMDTVLNLGLNDETVLGLRARAATSASPMTAIAAFCRCMARSCSASSTIISRS